MSSSPVYPERRTLLDFASAPVALSVHSFWLKALQSCDGHMSLYQLTVEQGTPLARDVKRGIAVCIHANPHTNYSSVTS